MQPQYVDLGAQIGAIVEAGGQPVLADCRFWLIMMTGAWIAASVESIRFRKM